MGLMVVDLTRMPLLVIPDLGETQGVPANDPNWNDNLTWDDTKTWSDTEGPQ